MCLSDVHIMCVYHAVYMYVPVFNFVLTHHTHMHVHTSHTHIHTHHTHTSHTHAHTHITHTHTHTDFQHLCAQNRGCGSLCLPNVWSVSLYSCACPTGIKLSADGLTCPKGELLEQRGPGGTGKSFMTMYVHDLGDVNVIMYIVHVYPIRAHCVYTYTCTPNPDVHVHVPPTYMYMYFDTIAYCEPTCDYIHVGLSLDLPPTPHM